MELIKRTLAVTDCAELEPLARAELSAAATSSDNVLYVSAISKSGELDSRLMLASFGFCRALESI